MVLTQYAITETGFLGQDKYFNWRENKCNFHFFLSCSCLKSSGENNYLITVIACFFSEVAKRHPKSEKSKQHQCSLLFPAFLDCSSDDSQIWHEKGGENGNRSYPALPSNTRSFTCAQREIQETWEGKLTHLEWFGWHAKFEKLIYITLLGNLCIATTSFLKFYSFLKLSIVLNILLDTIFLLNPPGFSSQRNILSSKKDVDLQLIIPLAALPWSQRKPFRVYWDRNSGMASSYSKADSQRCPESSHTIMCISL